MLNLHQKIKIRIKKNKNGTLSYVFLIAFIMIMISLSLVNLMGYSLTNEQNSIDRIQSVNNVISVGEYCKKITLNYVDGQWVENLNSNDILIKFRDSLPSEISTKFVVALNNDRLGDGEIEYTVFSLESGETYQFSIKNMTVVSEIYGYTTEKVNGKDKEVPIYKDKIYKTGWMFGVKLMSIN